MDPKRLRLVSIAAAISIVLIALVSFVGGSAGGKKRNPVTITSQSPSSGGLTIADLMNTKPATTSGAATPQPRLMKADPAMISELMETGNRHFMSGELATARSYYSKAATMDPTCERCQSKLDSLEKLMTDEVRDAFRQGESYMQTGRYDQAILVLDRVLTLVPDTTSVHHVNAKTLIEDAKLKKAQSGR